MGSADLTEHTQHAHLDSICSGVLYSQTPLPQGGAPIILSDPRANPGQSSNHCRPPVFLIYRVQASIMAGAITRMRVDGVVVNTVGDRACPGGPQESPCFGDSVR